jgi:PhnB protein
MQAAAQEKFVMGMEEAKNPAANGMKRMTVAPLLSVRRGTRAIEFYKNAFGAVELFRNVSDDGAVVAEMAIEDSHFWLADESPENQNFSPATLGGSTVRMVLVVDDPDSVFDRAVAAGAKGLWPVVDQPYGWRIGRVVDPFGHHWEIGKVLDAPSSVG